MKQELQNLDYCNKTILLKNDIEMNFISFGEKLYQIRKKELYKPQWESFAEFCTELKMSQNTVNKFIQIFETFILDYGFTSQQITTAGGWSVLQEILPVVKTKKEAVHWLTQATTLTRSDLRKTLHENKAGVDMTTCPHKNVYLLQICKDCNDKHEVFTIK